MFVTRLKPLHHSGLKRLSYKDFEILKFKIPFLRQVQNTKTNKFLKKKKTDEIGLFGQFKSAI